MSIENWRHLTRSDFADAPDERWFDTLILLLNRHMTDVTSLLQGGITAENELADVVELPLKHGVATEFQTRVATPREVLVQWSEAAITSFRWDHTGEKKITATAEFQGAPSDARTVRFKVRG